QRREVEAFLYGDVEVRVLAEANSASVVDDHGGDGGEVRLRRGLQRAMKIGFEGFPVAGRGVFGQQGGADLAEGPQGQRRRDGGSACSLLRIIHVFAPFALPRVLRLPLPDLLDEGGPGVVAHSDDGLLAVLRVAYKHIVRDVRTLHALGAAAAAVGGFEPAEV